MIWNANEARPVLVVSDRERKRYRKAFRKRFLSKSYISVRIWCNTIYCILPAWQSSTSALLSWGKYRPVCWRGATIAARRPEKSVQLGPLSVPPPPPLCDKHKRVTVPPLPQMNWGLFHRALINCVDATFIYSGGNILYSCMTAMVPSLQLWHNCTGFPSQEQKKTLLMNEWANEWIKGMKSSKAFTFCFYTITVHKVSSGLWITEANVNCSCSVTW